MSWTRNNSAHYSAFINCRVLAGMPRGESFAEAETYKLKHLDYWTQSASPTQRKTRAKALAIRMDEANRDFFGVNYEDGWNVKKMYNTIYSLLVEGDNNVGKLGNVFDTGYRYRDED